MRDKDIRSFAIGESPCSTSILQISLIASFIGGTATIGLAESTFTHGLVFTMAISGMALSRILEAKIVLPKISKYFGFLSVSEIMGSLYGTNARVFTALAAILGAIFVVAVQLIALGVVFQSMFNIPPIIGIVISAFIVTIYSTLGGIRAITYTDIFQFSILIVAIPLIAFFSLASIGGFDQLTILPNHADNNPSHSQIFKDIISTFIACSFPALFPEMIQRFLMTQDTKRIRNALYVNALAILPIFFLTGIIGVIAAKNFPTIEPNLAFPIMVKEVLPIGIKGIVISGLLAVMMSSADSFLNTIPIAISHDILKPLFPKKLTERNVLFIAQATTVMAGILAVVIALGSDSIFSVLLISMRFWIPFVSPGLMLGILGVKLPKLAFWWGIAAALVTWSLASYLRIDSSIGACLGALCNGCSLLYFSRSTRPLMHRTQNQWPKQFYMVTKTLLFSQIKRLRFSIYADKHYETISGFLIIYSIATIVTFSLNGHQLPTIYFVFCILSSLLSLILILRDLTKFQHKTLIGYAWHGALFFTILPSATLALSSNLNPGLCVGLLISFLFLNSLTASKKSIALLIASVAVGYFLHIVDGQVINIPITVTFEDAIVKCLMVICYIIIIRSKESNALDALTGFVSHEINHSISSFHINENLLSKLIEPLVVSYELARKNSVAVPEISHNQLNALRRMPTQVKHNTDRIRNNLELLSSKIESRMPNQCSAKKCVKNALNCFDPIFELDQKVSFDESEDFHFLGEEKVFINVFHNLIHNSLHEINKVQKGIITIAIDEKQRTVTITDTAKGISKEVLGRIFSPGFTTKPEGMGIGLNFCHNALENIGGTIVCDSVENQYARFILTFPSRIEVIK
jgi:SSS family solute:Na+ symporter